MRIGVRVSDPELSQSFVDPKVHAMP